MKYYHLAANNGYSGSLEMASFPDEMRQDIWGNTITSTGKMLVEDAEVDAKEFALMFEIDGDEEAERYCIYRVYADRPDVAGATKSESVEVQTQSCDLTAMVYYRTTSETPSATYSSFYSSVATSLS